MISQLTKYATLKLIATMKFIDENMWLDLLHVTKLAKYCDIQKISNVRYQYHYNPNRQNKEIVSAPHSLTCLIYQNLRISFDFSPLSFLNVPGNKLK